MAARLEQALNAGHSGDKIFVKSIRTPPQKNEHVATASYETRLSPTTTTGWRIMGRLLDRRANVKSAYGNVAKHSDPRVSTTNTALGGSSTEYGAVATDPDTGVQRAKRIETADGLGSNTGSPIAVQKTAVGLVNMRWPIFYRRQQQNDGPTPNGDTINGGVIDTDANTNVNTDGGTSVDADEGATAAGAGPSQGIPPDSQASPGSGATVPGSEGGNTQQQQQPTLASGLVFASADANTDGGTSVNTDEGATAAGEGPSQTKRNGSPWNRDWEHPAAAAAANLAFNNIRAGVRVSRWVGASGYSCDYDSTRSHDSRCVGAEYIYRWDGGVEPGCRPIGHQHCPDTSTSITTPDPTTSTSTATTILSAPTLSPSSTSSSAAPTSSPPPPPMAPAIITAQRYCRNHHRSRSTAPPTLGGLFMWKRRLRRRTDAISRTAFVRGARPRLGHPPNFSAQPHPPPTQRTASYSPTGSHAGSPAHRCSARGGRDGSIFHEEVWPPPGAESRLVDPFMRSREVDLGGIVDGVMGPDAGGEGQTHTRAHTRESTGSSSSSHAYAYREAGYASHDASAVHYPHSALPPGASPASPPGTSVTLRPTSPTSPVSPTSPPLMVPPVIALRGATPPPGYTPANSSGAHLGAGMEQKEASKVQMRQAMTPGASKPGRPSPLARAPSVGGSSGGGAMRARMGRGWGGGGG
ncbi:hypothetical protein BD779DRAFT_1469057 [Infundibulicybe gibba]|nr:hypothetical protein BD779DRAFT_1469057 [Infundibulicybe gibba]